MDTNEVQFSENAEVDLQGEDNTPAAPENNVPAGVLTEDRFRELMAVERQQIAEESARAFRAKQSMVDKKARQVAEEAKKQLQSLKDSGGNITPEAESSFINRAVNQYMESVSEEATEPAQVRTSNTGREPTHDYFAKRMDRITKKADGLIVTEKDPEGEVLLDAWKKVQSGGDPDDFIDVYESQLAKKARREGTPAQARVASIGGGGGSSAATVESYKREVMKHKGDAKMWNEVKEKYRKQGVPVDTVKFTQSQ